MMKRRTTQRTALLLAMLMVCLLLPTAGLAAEVSHTALAYSTGSVAVSYWPSDPEDTWASGSLTLNVTGASGDVVYKSGFSIRDAAGDPLPAVRVSLASDVTLTGAGDTAVLEVLAKKETLTGPVSLPCKIYYNNFPIGAAGTETFTLDKTLNAPRTGKDFSAFSVNGCAGTIDTTVTPKKITVLVPYGTSLTALRPAFTVPDGASVWVGGEKQLSNTSPVDFSSGTPVTYTVTAEDGASHDYAVKVTADANNACEITAFSVPGQSSTDIDQTNKSITIHMPSTFTGTSITEVPVITLSTGATINPSANLRQTFTDSAPFLYTVTAQDGVTTQNYEVRLGANASPSATPTPSTGTATPTPSPTATPTPSASAATPTPTPGANAVSGGTAITNVEGSISVVAASGTSAANPSLTTTLLFAGDVYNEMKKTAGNAKILTAYDITLVNPGTLRGPYFITFNVGRANAGRTVTVLHRKSERNYETALATVDGSGRLAIRASSLSPFMILNGYVTVSGAATEINTIPLGATGGSITNSNGGSISVPKSGAMDETGAGLLFMIIAVLLALLVVLYLWLDNRERE